MICAIEQLNYALENNHSTILRAAKEKGLHYLVEHSQIIYSIATVESKEFAEGLEML